MSSDYIICLYSERMNHNFSLPFNLLFPSFKFFKVNYFILQVLATISQLNLDNKEQKQTIYRASQLLADSNGEVLGAVMDFLFEAASRCHHIPQAVSV